MVIIEYVYRGTTINLDMQIYIYYDPPDSIGFLNYALLKKLFNLYDRRDKNI